jgi:hypothetical protein
MQINPARKKAGQSGVGLTPSVAFFFKARPEVRKAKAFGVNSKTGRCLNGSTQSGCGEPAEN